MPSPIASAIEPETRAIAVYRTIAESIYVKSTDQQIAIVNTTLDTVCTDFPCTEIADRWGVGSRWWATTTTIDEAEATAAGKSLLASGKQKVDLRRVSDDAERLVGVDADRVPLPGAAVEPWIAFRDGNGAAAGALRFSDVGFGSNGKLAMVFVEWRCGPACGHNLNVLLQATGDAKWRIADMILLSSLQR